MSKVG